MRSADERRLRQRAAEAREVCAAIAVLPDDQRDALVAIDVAGLCYREATEALHVREATVTSRLFRPGGRIAQSLPRARLASSCSGFAMELRRVRPVRPADKDLLRRAFEWLSPERLPQSGSSTDHLLPCTA